MLKAIRRDRQISRAHAGTNEIGIPASTAIARYAIAHVEKGTKHVQNLEGLYRSLHEEQRRSDDDVSAVQVQSTETTEELKIIRKWTGSYPSVNSNEHSHPNG